MMKHSLKAAYAGKKVLVTGHTGFKGSWLSLWLTQLGAEVTGYSLAPHTTPSLFNVLNLQNKINSIIGNILDSDKLEIAFQQSKPDVVFHLAAQPLVRLSYKEPKLTYETNVTGTLNVLEAVRKRPEIKACVLITTDKCYENKEWPHGYREIDPMGGYDPYSSSKACAELVISSYRNSYFNPNHFDKSHSTAIASTRAGNVIGGGDWSEDRLIPDAVRAIVKGESIYLRNPGATRPWQHVLESLAGYLWLGALMQNDGKRYSEAWNFGPYDESVISVEEVIKEIIAVWKKGSYIVNKEPQPHEANLLKLDISKAQALLGWKPVLGIEQAIYETINWYQSYYDHGNMLDFTIQQIEKYTAEASRKKVKWAELDDKGDGMIV